MRRLLLVIILCAILTALNACGSPIPAPSTTTIDQPLVENTAPALSPHCLLR